MQPGEPDGNNPTEHNPPMEGCRRVHGNDSVTGIRRCHQYFRRAVRVDTKTAAGGVEFWPSSRARPLNLLLHVQQKVEGG
jgi:hypothetical protein